MAGYDLVYVAIAPPGVLEANLIKKIAAIVNKDLYGTRLVLTGKIPRIIAHCQTMQTAESIAQSLRALGLVAIVCKDSELRKPLESYRAHTLRFGEGEILFQDRGGQVRRMESRNVFLILKGRMENYVETQAMRTKMKFSWPATVLTGGIPIWRKVKEKTKELSLQTQHFVRLYGWTSSEPTVEILQYDVDYSFLGVKMASSSFANFSTVATRLRDIFPQAVFDDKLIKSFRVDAPSATPRDDIELNCKLIYLCQLAASNLSSSA
jgi:hypothetical protein